MKSSYYKRLFSMSYQLLKVRSVNLGWLLLMALLMTMQILMLNAGLVVAKLVLVVGFLAGLPFEVTLVTTALFASNQLINQNDLLLLTTWRRFKKHWLPLLVMELLLLLVWAPFGDVGFSSAFINLVRLPVHVMDNFVMYRRIWLVLVAIGYLIVLTLFMLLTYRVVNGIINRREPQRHGLKSLWQFQRVFIRPFLRIMVPVVVIDEAVIFRFRALMLTITSQTLGKFLSVVVMIILITFTVMALSCLMVAMVWEALGQPSFKPVFDKDDATHTMAWFPAGLVLILVALFSFQAFHFSSPASASTTVAHRGAVDNNGVPNTLDSLEKTVKDHPNYVEIDVQETRDGKFVVCHNQRVREANNGKLANIQKTSLAKLTKIKVTEDGRKVYLTDLADYLRVAKQYKQRVIVEIKVTPDDSKNLAKRFAAQYGNTLVADRDFVHTMNYQTVKDLKKEVPNLIVGYIVPFNLVSVKHLPADFYSVQAIGLGKTIVQQAHSIGAPVFAWTPNHLSQMQLMRVYGVDGQITDRLTVLQEMNREQPSQFNWAIIQSLISQFI
ncbi:hypothetical protein AYR62_03935 [Secundilactobacillus paracollinoides]|uniref:glycerophosphodiester phosphodiesterase family protein n=1 Tax=Secundilactobacillus paracollinoides TaxID=240427 RepID=UPI00081A610F|nr:glycerophosphodiester phosphodiesterase family protein [Secundilactobacillus paracollinoides]ANZ63334.1 hypothetical protein AYR62_03935 [Secundilactobacillus paracollinoides]